MTRGCVRLLRPSGGRTPCGRRRVLEPIDSTARPSRRYSRRMYAIHDAQGHFVGRARSKVGAHRVTRRANHAGSRVAYKDLPQLTEKAYLSMTSRPGGKPRYRVIDVRGAAGSDKHTARGALLAAGFDGRHQLGGAEISDKMWDGDAGVWREMPDLGIVRRGTKTTTNRAGGGSGWLPSKPAASRAQGKHGERVRYWIPDGQGGGEWRWVTREESARLDADPEVQRNREIDAGEDLSWTTELEGGRRRRTSS